MAPATIQPAADTDAVNLEEGAILCDACRNHVSVAPYPTSCATDLLAVPKAAGSDVDQPTCAELHSSAPMGSCAKEPTSVSAAHVPRFDCNICLDACQDPVVTHCGHLFCWPCLYCWLSAHSLSYECPVCRAGVRDKIVPLYGRGEAAQATPKSAPAVSIFSPEMQIPCRPVPSPSPSEPSGTAAADAVAAVNHAFHQRGIYHSRSVDYAALGAGLAGPYTAADHAVHHRGVFNRRHRSNLLAHGTAAAGSTPGMKLCIAHFLAWALSRYSILASSSSPPAAYDHSGAAYAEGTNPRGGQRYGNEKQFVLQWALICVVTITSVCLICA